MLYTHLSPPGHAVTTLLDLSSNSWHCINTIHDTIHDPQSPSSSRPREYTHTNPPVSSGIKSPCCLAASSRSSQDRIARSHRRIAGSQVIAEDKPDARAIGATCHTGRGVEEVQEVQVVQVIQVPNRYPFDCNAQPATLRRTAALLYDAATLQATAQLLQLPRRP
ncbi:hypothetical protein CC85DRAFT_54487 [Cutaneotrichosporon oleaginosum]|uniref:Uncharacterized protein n=1 Tax=Cutaneotrichosporon oleaginosum TaxID=879819 RepID=A0A0J1BDH5_9TREE|nr:uncharacterized protein CC85DRAFT_54487 [Cutaneotrichosporon oleaginosum]KLT46109.1 hypothetical protein CC85DRAFT_54487 [Cutaneotrichosporon oleaginosum]TXT10121.1 hypothetical protein COLE_04055 [Cutaneotrichosporon oleaginosum]